MRSIYVTLRFKIRTVYTTVIPMTTGTMMEASAPRTVDAIIKQINNAIQEISPYQ